MKTMMKLFFVVLAIVAIAQVAIQAQAGDRPGIEHSPGV